MLKFPKSLFLASKSPRRIELLHLLNLEFNILNSEIEEDLSIHLHPAELVMHISYDKAKSASILINNGIILGADTIVVKDNLVLGKPANNLEAKEMLTSLSGKEHIVYSGFTLLDVPSGKFISDYEATSVKFIEYDDNLIDAYVHSGSPLDKAGAYGIQDGYGAVLVEKISGCYYNVMGLPLSKLYSRLKEFIRII